MSHPKHPKTPEQQQNPRQVPNAPRLEHRHQSRDTQAGRVLFPQAPLPAPQTPRRENRALLVVPPAPQKPRRPGR